jgi:superfamily II DNA helicase RecQ
MVFQTVPTSDLVASFLNTSTSAFQTQPYPWQAEVGATIIDFARRKTPKTTLLVMPTGKSKSAVRDVCGTVFRDIMLTLVPLSSLGADQFRKLNTRVDRTQANVAAFHLDKLNKTPDALQRLIRGLSGVPPNTMNAIFLFASPQLVVNNASVLASLLSLLGRGLLHLVAVDKIHLFCHFGLSFRAEFCALKDTFLKLVCQSNHSPPILLMTAMCSPHILLSIEEVTGFIINHRYWPATSGM